MNPPERNILSPAPQNGDAAANKPWRPELQGFDAAGPEGSAGDSSFAVEGEAAGGAGRLRAQLSRTNLALFALFLVGVGVVAFMAMRKGPQATNASQAESGKDANAAIERFMATYAKDDKTTAPAATGTAKDLLRDTKGLVELFFNFNSKSQVPLSELKTNPFRFATSQPDAAKPKPVSDAVAKKAEEDRKRNVEKDKADLAKLRLETVLEGRAGRQAMINSNIVKLGDLIEGFKVEQIEPRQVTLSRNGERYNLEISF